MKVSRFQIAGSCLVAAWAVAAAGAPMRAEGRQPLAAVAQDPAPPAPAQDAQASPTSVADGVYTPEQAKRGEALYGQYCSSCHGAALNGGEMAPALTGGDFATDWIGLTLNDLFERIRVSMPQDQPGSLSRQQNADVLAFMLSAGKYPAGKTELPKEAEVLKTIKFEAMKAPGL